MHKIDKSLEKDIGRPRRVKNLLVKAAFVLIFVLSAMSLNQKQAQACSSCATSDTDNAIDGMDDNQEWWDPVVEDDINDLINMHENWIIETFFEKFWVKALAELTEYLSVSAMYQIEVIGSFFDARNQLNTTQLYLKLQAEAHRDYRPSDDFCWFGTTARSLSASESRTNLNILALSKYGLGRQLGLKDMASAGGVIIDKTARWQQFVDTYCDPKDNGWERPGTGLERACDHDGAGGALDMGADDRTRVNNDIDYTRLIEIPRTLDFNFTNTASPTTPNQEDVIAMSANLYGSTGLSRGLEFNKIKDYPAAKSLYMDQRAVAAKRSVAQNAFNTIVSLKSAGTGLDAGAETGSFIAAVIKGMMPPLTPNEEIVAIMGENPSYYAQLEIIGKKIYENPDFFTSLYDTTVNVSRKSVAMKGIELMLDRALFESELRQEMMLSVMLSSELNKEHKSIAKNMQKGN